MLENYRREAGIRQIKKGIRSLEKRIAEHEAWIADPSMKLGSNVPANRLSEYVDKKWPKDIARQRAERDVLLGLLAEKRK